MQHVDGVDLSETAVVIGDREGIELQGIGDDEDIFKNGQQEKCAALQWVLYHVSRSFAFWTRGECTKKERAATRSLHSTGHLPRFCAPGCSCTWLASLLINPGKYYISQSLALVLLFNNEDHYYLVNALLMNYTRCSIG